MRIERRMRGGRRVLGAAVLAASTVAALAVPVAVTAAGGTRGAPEDTSANDAGARRGKLAYFDARRTPAARVQLRRRDAALAAKPNPATDQLKDALGSEAVVSIDPLTSTPRMVGLLDGFLTGPSGAAAKDVALDYVRGHAAAFGLDAATVAGLDLARDYVDVDGTHHLFFLQKANGIPVFGNGLKANVTSDGRLINVVGSPVAQPSLGSTTPKVSATAAVATARRNAGESVPPVRVLPGHAAAPVTFSNGDRASLVAFQDLGGLRLAWQTVVSGGSAAYEHVVDAATGRVLYRRSLVNYADGIVLDNYPGAAHGGVATQRSISLPGWLTSTTTLSGNNTHVYSDVDDSNDSTNGSGFDEEIHPSGGTDWLYPLQPFNDPPLDVLYQCSDAQPCTWDPRIGVFPNLTFDGSFSYEKNQGQDGTQLFYFINRYHDHLAAPPIGFTEAAGNFQVENASGKGLGGDPVLGEALDGANTYGFGDPDPNHTDNANFATPPDGQSPRMQMFLWHDPTTDFLLAPDADPFLPASGSNEADIVYHEYTHGLSNRLVVDALGNSTLGTIQAGAMGEAWSDWYALDFLVDEGFLTDTPAPGEVRVGGYVGKGADLIRTQPIDCPVGTTDPHCPGGADHAGGYTYGDFGKIAGVPEVHADGEIWGQTLWDLRAEIGSQAAERLVTRAMELAPANPSFLDMRNAILQADLVRGGARRDTIWKVFAARGMGYFAAVTDGDDAAPVESFTLPPGRHSEKGKLRGQVTDVDTNQPIPGAVVGFGGHDSGFPGDFADVTDKRGRYDIRRIFVGTYPKVNASAPGYDVSVDTVTVARGRAGFKNWALRRDWASLAGGGSVEQFNGPDYTDFGCGPSAAIDQSQGAGWGSTTDNDAGDATGLVTPKFVIVKLPVAVDVSEIAVNPSNTCGDPGSSATRGFRIETSTDGVVYAPLTEGVFYQENRGRLNSVFTGNAAGVRYLRFWMLNPQVPTDPDPDASCTGAADCGTDPDDQTGVAAHCGDGKDNGFGGCQFMDMSEIEVYGKTT
jgi:Zn-dependent metalloprotease